MSPSTTVSLTLPSLRIRILPPALVFSVREELDASSAAAIAGQRVFEWDQTLEEVSIYINLPPNVHPKQF